MKKIATFKNQMVIFTADKKGVKAESPEITAQLVQYGLTTIIRPYFGWFPSAGPAKGLVIHIYLTNPDHKGETKLIGIACPTKSTGALPSDFKGQNVFYPIVRFQKSKNGKGYVAFEEHTSKVILPIKDWKKVLDEDIQVGKEYRVQLKENGTVLLATPIEAINTVRVDNVTKDLVLVGDTVSLTLQHCQFVLNPLSNQYIRFDKILKLTDVFTEAGKVNLDPALIKKQFKALKIVTHPDKFVGSGNYLEDANKAKTRMVDIARMQALAHIGEYDPLAKQLEVEPDDIRAILEGENLHLAKDTIDVDCPVCKKSIPFTKGKTLTCPHCKWVDPKKIVKTVNKQTVTA